jgi:2,4-dienoyl-CoA reductase-like NADH-dependent reductase (Old Yellow Enzyme family)
VPHLFDPLRVGPLTIANRVAIAPMCQYSAHDGSATDWHLQHLMQLAIARAGMVMVEATAVERAGRITHGCLGLYDDANEAALKRVVDAAKRVAAPGTCFGIQLAHAGRKASATFPWAGGRALAAADKPWQTVAPSAVPFAAAWHTPQAVDAAGLEHIIASFREAAERAVRIGFEAIELHAAHGYLLHQFLSPLSNQRSDAYGGSLANRMRFPLEVARAVRAVIPPTIIMGARITGCDWVEGGAGPDVAVAFAAALKAIGANYACISSGGLVATAKVPFAANYQVPFAEQVRRETGILTRAVGLIVEPAQADAIIASGQADFVALARGILDNPRWVWHAADRLGATVSYPPQYDRVRAGTWPGASMVRPGLHEAIS